MRKMDTICLGGLGAPVIILRRNSRTPAPLNHEFRRNDNLHQFEFWHARTRLSRQSGVLKASIGASRRVRRGPSLGELTSAGASNSQATLHADRATDGDELTRLCLAEKSLHPDFSLAHSGSELMTRNNTKTEFLSRNQRIKRDALVVFELSMKRAGIRCPKWARTWSMRREFLKVYKRAQWQRRFRHNKYHVDHIIPLHGELVSGLHVPWNLHVIRAEINMAKGTLVVDEWIPRIVDPEPTFMQWFVNSLEEDRCE